ncbi:MAG TPA: hybrid sensor histidine kinase/response regulator, partial [Planctomycetota bacterium]|nr:hybrid sensor histidine kinase/response regulator [Planctomycetota bacterium]
MRAAISEHLDARELLKLLRAVKDGDFTKRIPLGESGVESEIALALNEIIAMNEAMATELQRIGHVVGKEGKLGERAMLVDARGSWASSIDAINGLIDDLGQPTNEMARVIGAVAEGNLSQTMPMEIEGRPVKGAFLSIARTVNTMVDQLNAFSSEVTRVAREVGTEGKLGGQADVKGVAGVWKGLTDNVNLMASNL